MTQAQAVIETIDKLGGIATLNQINQHIFEIEDCAWKTKTPFAVILLDISDERQRVGDGTSGMSREDFDELLLERSSRDTYWLHFAVRPNDNRMKIRLIQT